MPREDEDFSPPPDEELSDRDEDENYRPGPSSRKRGREALPNGNRKSVSIQP